MKKRLTFNKYKSNSNARNTLEDELNSPHGNEDIYNTKRNKVSSRMGMTTFKSRGNSHGHGLQLGNFISNNPDVTKTTFKNSSLINNYGKTMNNYENSRIQGHMIESLANVNDSNKQKYYTPKTVQKNDDESTKSFTKIFNFPPLTVNTLDDFVIKGCVGKGAYAKVYVAKRISNNKPYAIKVYSKDYLTKPHRIVNVQNEISIGSTIRHQNIVKLYYVNETSDTVNLIMEYGGKTSIEKLIEKMPDKKIPESIAAKIFYNCLLGLSFLHNQQIYHRDIKLGNVLVMEDFNAKFIDFGFSVKTAPDEKISVFCGTPSYMAPEVIFKQNHSYESDYYAIGVICHELMLNKRPYKGRTRKDLKEQMLHKKIKLRPSQCPRGWDEGVVDFINQCLKKQDQERGSAEELLVRAEWACGKAGALEHNCINIYIYVHIYLYI